MLLLGVALFELGTIVVLGGLFLEVRALKRKLELFRSIYEYERRHGPIPDEDEI